MYTYAYVCIYLYSMLDCFHMRLNVYMCMSCLFVFHIGLAILNKRKFVQGGEMLERGVQRDPL